MSFKPISINSFIAIQLKENPNIDKMDLRERLNIALSDYKNGIKCSCGNDIWVIGSALVGNNCFTCITGESYPNKDYELVSAIKKYPPISDNHINDNVFEINGFYNDDGHKINMDTIPKPALCVSCINNNNSKEEILCMMTRHDQKDEEEFTCFAYSKLSD